MTHTSPRQLLEQSEVLFSEADVAAAIQRLADDVSNVLADSDPLVLCVMSGATVFAGHLLPLLKFPLEFDYVQASRYHNRTTGGDDVVWKMSPGENVRGRTLLLLDDILDEGHTLAAVRKKCLEAGAARVLIAVLTEKETGHEKPVRADFVGLTVPNRYVFGCGMDVYGWWRNLPAIHALKN
ncbi:MAG TPA: hypoxanthine-guanine phosphoribosyltransferase [Methylophilaceae bacterium]|nr:hypoxanthine-guanine phosphoribosyltransferase [Methylophilaceae bacterium]